MDRFLHGSVETVEAGDLDAYICSQCGYTEWYAPPTVVNEALAKVLEHPEEGVTLLDAPMDGFR